ncbi:ubiquinol-cytochrome c reductase iron-sulfur subunit [Reticulomyxa filosa]|uniref:Cytochrome b-c1 complex subunit Rieske, mitochondrial n=1 Tax=Reticulomyxa filosa TaxID=46433 RepID=X6PFA0_RETFI|nr:ubiquinol-cytochrome c reductase iron-sulfur subunit [Reticulomyxa filosa]|eukprot:ETO36788.1 ubiquinol-cytochrome c reductase iron-sulfur subunit [Reticulomyxa filosa]
MKKRENTKRKKTIHTKQKKNEALSYVSTRSGVTDTEKFKEIWHTTDSIDPLYEICKKPTERLDPTRRAHAYLMYGGVYGFGFLATKTAIETIVTYLNQPADVKAMGEVEVNLADIPLGTCIVLMWKDSPVFVWHRTPKDIANAEKDDNNSTLRDPENDVDRVKNKEWYVSMAVCTHLGCVPIYGQGNYSGFFCPCHGSHYDASGRVRKV